MLSHVLLRTKRVASIVSYPNRIARGQPTARRRDRRSQSPRSPRRFGHCRPLHPPTPNFRCRLNLFRDLLSYPGRKQ
jgi:hypothetical protein